MITYITEAEYIVAVKLLSASEAIPYTYN